MLAIFMFLSLWIVSFLACYDRIAFYANQAGITRGRGCQRINGKMAHSRNADRSPLGPPRPECSRQSTRSARQSRRRAPIIAGLRAAGVTSLNGIAAALDERYLPTPGEAVIGTRRESRVPRRTIAPPAPRRPATSLRAIAAGLNERGSALVQAAKELTAEDFNRPCGARLRDGEREGLPGDERAQHAGGIAPPPSLGGPPCTNPAEGRLPLRRGV
jgi:hypothetical protein